MEERIRQEILANQGKAEIPKMVLSTDGHALLKALLRTNPLRQPTCQALRKFRIFTGVELDGPSREVPHKNSVKNVTDKNGHPFYTQAQHTPTFIVTHHHT